MTRSWPTQSRCRSFSCPQPTELCKIVGCAPAAPPNPGAPPQSAGRIGGAASGRTPKPPAPDPRQTDVLRPGAAQRGDHSLAFLVLYLRVAQPQQGLRIPLALEEGPKDLQAADADPIGNHAVKLDIHPFQRLLHLVDWAAGPDNVVGPHSRRFKGARRDQSSGWSPK